jgi:acetylserotonin N-methyltransferase
MLARKAYAALDPGGTIALHEVLLHERKDGPLGAACFSTAMLLSQRGKQYTLPELRGILASAGFEDCRAEPALGRYHLVCAVRPGGA